MKRWLAVWLMAGGLGIAALADDLASRAIILANADDPDSLRVARHYAEVRGVPAENIFAFKMTTNDGVNWHEFVTQIWEPLRTELIAKKWIDGMAMETTDDVGRKKYVMNHHRIAALVVCRGVPYRVYEDQRLIRENGPLTLQKELRTNSGAVDSELTLLATANYNITAFVKNPLFANETRGASESSQIIPVGRLDGPTVDDAQALVDHAIAAEKTGLIGRAYVDIGGPFAEGDRWMESAAAQIEALGFDNTVERSGATFSNSARYDAPVLYFGWYTGNLNGPPSLPGFQFAPGAIAEHIHSFSAGTMRSATEGWTAPLVAHGVSATVGNVFEPYLGFLHRPDLLLRALARGATLGEAGLYSVPVLSWQTMLIGDPLYRPFAVSLDEQWKNRANLSAPAVGYVTLRRMRLLERTGKIAEALELGRSVQRETPSLALAMGLAERFQKANDDSAAGEVLDYATTLKSFAPDQWGLANEAAQMLAANGRPDAAVTVYQTLLATKTLSAELRLSWLRGAAKIAAKAKAQAQSAAWEKEADELAAPPKK